MVSSSGNSTNSSVAIFKSDDKVVSNSDDVIGSVGCSKEEETGVGCSVVCVSIDVIESVVCSDKE